MIFSTLDSFQSMLALGTRDFTDAIFNVQMKLTDLTFDEGISFKNCRFREGVHIDGVEFKGNVNFDESHFSVENGSACTIKAKFIEGEVSFKSCTFNTAIYFNESHFNSKVIFNESSFAEKALFHRAKFENETSFSNTKFLKLADFYHASFNLIHIFYKTDFNGNAVFSRVNFNKNVCFHYVSGKSNLIFRHANFEDGLDLSLAIIDGQINFFNVRLSNFKSKKDPPETEEGGEKYDELVEGGTITHKNKRETFRIIKDQLVSQNNVIESLIYKRLEMRALMGETFSSLFTLKFWKIPLNTISISFLSWISNNFGKSWIRGVLFTFAMAILFFSIAVLYLQDYPYTFGSGHTLEAFEYGAKYFFKFLIPTHKIDFMSNDFKPNGWGFYVADICGRIFISFGIYQTISAFRKFSKK